MLLRSNKIVEPIGPLESMIPGGFSFVFSHGKNWGVWFIWIKGSSLVCGRQASRNEEF
jgi:hypothetical protein